MPKTCFVISPIGEAGSEIRKRADQLFEHIVSPVLATMTYAPVRADQIAEPGIITTQVIERVVEADLVIADLTGRNPNVFYELAIRHATRRPLVQIIRTGEQIPFDVAGMRTIQIDLQDLDSVADAKKELKAQVLAIEDGKSSQDNPISVSLDLKVLRQSGNPEKRSLAEIIEGIGEIQAGVAAINAKLDKSPSGVNAASMRLPTRRDIELEFEKYLEYHVPRDQAIRTIARHHNLLPEFVELMIFSPDTAEKERTSKRKTPTSLPK